MSEASASASAKQQPIQEGYLGNLNEEQQNALDLFMQQAATDHSAVKAKRRAAEAKRAANPNWDKDLPAWVERPFIYTEAEEKEEFILEALRFLRSRKFDVDKALEKYRNYLKFCDEYNIYSILDTLPPKFTEADRIIPHWLGGESKEHWPCYTELDGLINVDAMLHYFNESEVLKVHVWTQELLVRRAKLAARKHGQHIENIVNVLDLNGLKMDHRRALKFLKPVLGCDEANYPERMGRLFVINAPWVFPVIWNIVKYWLDPVTKSKIVIVKGNPAEVLKEHFELDQLPKTYGGTAPDIAVSDISDLLTAVKSAEEAMEFETVKVSAGKKIEKSIEVKANATVSWYIKTHKHDIALSAIFLPKDETNNPVTVIEKSRVNGEKIAIQGTWSSPSAGTVTFVYDNTFSYFKGKTIMFLITVADDIQSEGTATYDAKAQMVNVDSKVTPSASPDEDD